MSIISLDDIKIIKKDGTLESFNIDKVVKAIKKSSERVLNKLTDKQIEDICFKVKSEVLNEGKNVDISEMHNIVETILSSVNEDVAKSYRDYRNYKQDFVHMLDKVYQENQRIMFIGDKENANIDSTLVSTKRALVYNELSKEMYKKFFLTKEELQASNDGYIYIHDMSARLNTMNCCLFDIANVLKGGFEMGNLKYNEPQSLDVAFDVIGDIIMSMSAQQYGGASFAEIDSVLEPYAEKSYNRYYQKYINLGIEKNKADKQSMLDVQKDFEQGWQALECKLNTVGSSRGDTPFVSVTCGLSLKRFGRMCNEIMLKTRMNGQGTKGNKKPVIFPKIIFLYDKKLHGEDGELKYLYDLGVECSKKAMYPDWLSLTGEGYVASMYKKYGQVVSPMGCVEGNEVITYMIDNNLFVESFERMWNRITNIKTHIGQNSIGDINRYIDLRDLDVKIFDTKLNDFTKVNALIRNLQNNWCNVGISNGRNVQVTTDHPFETENRGVVLAKDLKKDDIIRFQKNQFNRENISINESLAWLYGVMLCDGCYSSNAIFGSFAYEDENDIIKAFCDSFKENFGVKPELIEQNRGKSGHYYDVRVYSNNIKSLSELSALFLEKFGGLQKIHRQIPNEVFSYTKECKLAFLAGMIDADGYINNSGRHIPTVQIGSTNKELAIQQMLLAQSLGMYAKLYHNHYNSKDKNKIRYRVEFHPTLELIQYLKCQKKIDKFTAFDYTNKIEQGTIRKVEILDNIEQYSYDVTTESEHFEFSGIYSHNCRAFLSPWYERGGMHPIDENDKPVFVGRFNIGAVSLHLPMIYMKAKKENKDFYEVLDYYLNLIRKLHIRTYEYLGEMKASTNPLGYCEGGFYGGNLNPSDKIKSLLKPMTASFGITALNELQQLYNHKSLVEDGQFAIEVMEYINKKVNEFKEEDGWLYALYGTPAESLAEKQVYQFRKKYGIIENVSDRLYVSNSFHCHVTENITPIEKQNYEKRFWDLFNGGKIQYVKYPIDYNTEAIKTIINRAMDMGFYEGVNLSLSYCDDCGHQELGMDVCPKCGSNNITSINRVTGYLGYSRLKGDTRFNKGKLAEVKDRVSM